MRKDQTKATPKAEKQKRLSPDKLTKTTNRATLNWRGGVESGHRWLYSGGNKI